MTSASSDSRYPIAFSTRTPSTSSKSLSYLRDASIRSPSVAVAGGGSTRIRERGMPPSRSTSSSSVSGCESGAWITLSFAVAVVIACVKKGLFT